MPGVTFCKRSTDYFVILFTHKNIYTNSNVRECTEQGVLAVWMAGVWEALGTGICAVLRGVSGVLALTGGSLGVGPMEGRGGVGGAVLEAT